MKKLLMAAVIAGVAAVVKGKSKTEREAWQGLSESEARERLEQRLPSKIPDDRREEIKDKVVSKMVERGVLTADPADANPAVDLTNSSAPPPVSTDA